MICPNCGTQNAYGETICMGCKETLPQIDPKALKESEKADKSEKEEKSKKKDSAKETKKTKGTGSRPKNKNLIKGIIGILILAIVVVAAIIVYRYKTKNLNANDPIVRLETVVNEFSVDPADYVKYIFPEAIAKDASSALGALEDADETPELVKSFKNTVEGAFESWKDTYGDDLEISLDILYKEKLEEDKLNEIENFYAIAFAKYVLADSLSYDSLVAKVENDYKLSNGKAKKVATGLNNIQQYCSNIQVTAGYDLVVRLGFNGRQSTGDLLLDVYVVKVDGTWSIDINSTIEKYLENPVLTDAIKIK